MKKSLHTILHVGAATYLHDWGAFPKYIQKDKGIAQFRLERMEQSLGWLLEESFGTL
jgi:hypothetical protein